VEAIMKLSKKKANIIGQCVACGCCVKTCPLDAIAISKGIRAVIDEQKCVGCGKCEDACPASVIFMALREDVKDEAKALV